MKNEKSLFDKIEDARLLERQLDSEMAEANKNIRNLRTKLYCARLDRKSLNRKFDFIKTHADAADIETLIKIFPMFETARQIQIANEMTKLKTEREIALACFIDIKTVKWHKSLIYKTLKLHSEKQFLLEFMTRKLILEKEQNDKR